jgi:hypothetical protein
MKPDHHRACAVRGDGRRRVHLLAARGAIEQRGRLDLADAHDHEIAARIFGWIDRRSHDEALAVERDAREAASGDRDASGGDDEVLVAAEGDVRVHACRPDVHRRAGGDAVTRVHRPRDVVFGPHGECVMRAVGRDRGLHLPGGRRRGDWGYCDGVSVRSPPRRTNRPTGTGEAERSLLYNARPLRQEQECEINH